MKCEFESRVSLLVDGELSPEEVARVEAHVAGCEGCRQLERDLLHLGQAVRAYDPALDRTAAEAFGSVMAASGGGFWKRRVTIPLSLAAAAMLALVSLGIWTVYRQVSPGEPPASVKLAEPTVGMPGLDRFDRGQRAVLYKVRDEEL